MRIKLNTQTLCWQYAEFLGPFAKLWEDTFSSVMYVRSFSVPTGWSFMKFDIVIFFKSV